MSNWVRKMFAAKPPRTVRRPAPAAGTRLGVESLGDRLLPSVTVGFVGNTLTINADSAGSAVEVRPLGSRVGVYSNGQVVATAITSMVSGIQFNGGAGNDTFANRTALPAFIYGNGGNDTLTGGGAADRLDGGSGDDTLSGGAGNDRYVFGANGYDGADNLSEAFGQDGGVDTLDFSAGTQMGVNIDLNIMWGRQQLNGSQAVILSGQFENVVGTQSDDTIWGNSLPNVLYGMGGNDTLEGRDGNDYLSGGDGKDTLSGGAGADWLDGGNGKDKLWGNSKENKWDGEKDMLVGGAGLDESNGDGGVAWLSIVTGEGEDNVSSGIDEFALGCFVEIYKAQMGVGMATAGAIS